MRREVSVSLGTRASPSAIPSLRSALTSFGGYPAPRLGAPGACAPLRGAILRRPDTASSSCAVPRRAIAEPRLAVSLRSTRSPLPRFLIMIDSPCSWYGFKI